MIFPKFQDISSLISSHDLLLEYYNPESIFILQELSIHPHEPIVDSNSTMRMIYYSWFSAQEGIEHDYTPHYGSILGV